MPDNKWEEQRIDIENITREYHISRADFAPLDIHADWAGIEERIYHTFCRLDHPTARPIWLWEKFKLDTFSMVVDFPFSILDKLVDHEEEIWFFLNGDHDKFWFYQGKITAILKVIKESAYIDELYLASKKYEWLLCINHHDVLIATGQEMAERLSSLSNKPF
jgi:hypothetical protein